MNTTGRLTVLISHLLIWAIGGTASPTSGQITQQKQISICAVAPKTLTGVAVLDGTVTPATGDTVVSIGGKQVTIQQHFVLSDTSSYAEWLAGSWDIQGETITLPLHNRAAFAATYPIQHVSAQDVQLVGMWQGKHIYAARQELGYIVAHVQDLRGAVVDISLGDVVTLDSLIATTLDEIETFYVPLQPWGCVFQPISRVQNIGQFEPPIPPLEDFPKTGMVVPVTDGRPDLLTALHNEVNSGGWLVSEPTGSLGANNIIVIPEQRDIENGRRRRQVFLRVELRRALQGEQCGSAMISWIVTSKGRGERTWQPTTEDQNHWPNEREVVRQWIQKEGRCALQ